MLNCRILFVNNIAFNPKFGGIERVTDVLTKSLINRGATVYYLSEASYKGQLEYNLPAPSFGLDDITTSERWRYVDNIIKDNRIRLIINQRGQMESMSYLYGHKGVQVISVLHSAPKAFIKCELCHILKFNALKLTSRLRYLIKLILYPLIYLYRLCLAIRYFRRQFEYIDENSAAIVLLSEKYKSDFRAILGKRETTRLFGIPNMNTFSSVQVECNTKDKVVLYVGRLNKEEKNPSRLLKIWKKIYNKFPEWRLIFVGEGEEREYLERYVDKYNMSRVTFTGVQSQVEDYYRIASIVCLTSNFEGWGLALTEGMQYGCVPMTFNNYKAASDIIDDGINGYLVSPYNLNEYAARLSRLMSDDAIRERMSQSAIEKVKKFDTDEIVDLWENLFRKVVNNSE